MLRKISRRAKRLGATQAFTLIELLVVVAIIALMAAILFPVFGRARENARRSSCQSNLKQIGLGIMQYVQDFDETMPRVYFQNHATSDTIPNNTGNAGYRVQDEPTGENNPIVNYKWMDAVFPYIKSEQIFVCPSAGSRRVGTNASVSPPNRYRYRGGAAPTGVGVAEFGSYAINGSYRNNHATIPEFRHSPPGHKISIITNAADTILAAEGNALVCFGPLNGQEFFSILPNYSEPRVFSEDGGNFANLEVNGTSVIERHLGTTNVLYADGHVKAKKLDEFAPTKTLVWRQGSSAQPIHTSLTVEDD